MTPEASHSGALSGPAEPLDITFNQDALAQLSAGFGKFGDAFRMSATVTGAPIYVFSHPEHVRRVLVDNHQNYTKGIGIERVGILLGKGLMVSEGDLWRRQRRMIHPRFTATLSRACWDISARLTRHCSRNG